MPRPRSQPPVQRHYLVPNLRFTAIPRSQPQVGNAFCFAPQSGLRSKPEWIPKQSSHRYTQVPSNKCRVGRETHHFGGSVGWAFRHFVATSFLPTLRNEVAERSKTI
jgi:hypothetical protein